MVVIAIIALLAGLYLPALHKAKAKGNQIRCLSNLRQLGLAFRMFADDNNSQYPMQVARAAGGTKEFVEQGETWQHFLLLSNYLSTPKLLVCPADRQAVITNWTQMTNTSISYFVGVDAKYGNSTHFLSGDRNIAISTDDDGKVVWLNKGEQVSWTQELHNGSGNILFADNHIEMLNNKELRLATARSTGTSK